MIYRMLWEWDVIFRNLYNFSGSIEINNDVNSMKKVILKYYNAKPSKVDVWDFQLFVNKV